MTSAILEVPRDSAEASNPGVDWYATFAAKVLANTKPAWLRALREQAWERFAATGIPTTHDEEWRFTSVKALGATPFTPTFAGAVLHHGALPAGVKLLPLSEAIAQGVPEVERHLARYASPDVTPFAALNAALFTDGVVLVVPDGVVIEEPIRIAHQGSAADSCYTSRVLLVLGRNAQATVLEHFGHRGTDSYFTNACADVVLAEGARLEHLRLQDESIAAWHVGLTQVDQQRDSHYRSFTLGLGGKLARHNLHARLNAPNIETLLYGLYLPKGEQLMDNHTAIYHDQPNCNSWEVYKGVLTDFARGVFNGKVFVQPEAQKTDAKQTNRNLLLSDTARVDTKPQLEIFADDVRCTHGATIGKPDPQQRYYLQTRGIGGKTAQSLLLWAFTAEVVGEITHAGLRAEVEADVRARLYSMIA